MKVTEEMIRVGEAQLAKCWSEAECSRGDAVEHVLRAVLDLIETQEGPEAHADLSMINLRGVSEKSAVMTVSREEYEQAKHDGTLDHMLDVYLSDMDGETYVIEPGGTVVYPYS